MNVNDLDYNFNFPGLQELVLQYYPNLELNTVHPMDLIDSVSKGMGQEGITRLYLSCTSQLGENKKTTNSLAEMVNWIYTLNQESQSVNRILIDNVPPLVEVSDSLSVEGRMMPISKKRKFVSLSNEEVKDAEVSSESLKKKPKLDSMSNEERNDSENAIASSKQQNQRVLRVRRNIKVLPLDDSEDAIASSKQQIKRRLRGRWNISVETVCTYAQFIMENLPEHKSEASWMQENLKEKAAKAKITQVNRNALKRGIMHMKDCSSIPAIHRDTAQRFFAYLYTNNSYKFSEVNEKCEYCKESERSGFSETTSPISRLANHANVTSDVSVSQGNLFYLATATDDHMLEALTASVASVGKLNVGPEFSFKENFFRTSNQSGNTDGDLAFLAIPIGQKSSTLLKTCKLKH